MSQNILNEISSNSFSFHWIADQYPELSVLKNIPQNPAYHGEGDVYRHTEMVCETLVELPEWQNLAKEEQELLFLAAVFH
ncbi:MAG: poly(A) polymerase, partial [Lachnospiraceae bacterium]|nr:poly(A) polymerase [Lachnospiraceae bacterium]